MVDCLVCHKEVIHVHEADIWQFGEFCSEECYQQSNEYKYLDRTMDDFLEKLSPLQISYLDLFIAYDDYNFRQFLNKVHLKCV